MFNHTQWGTRIIDNETALKNITDIFKNTFNQTPNLSPQGVIGVMIQELANQNINVNSSMAYVCSNVYSLNSTNGIFLDGIGDLFGNSRMKATATIVNCEILGEDGTFIPKGSQVSDGVNTFVSINDYTISNGVLLAFECTNVGAIIVSPNTINTIISMIDGWSSVNNPEAGNVGRNLQNDTSYRYQLKYCSAVNGRSMAESLYSAFANFMTQTGALNIIDNHVVYPYIQGFYIFVNNTSEPQVIIEGRPPVPIGGVYITLYAPQFLNSQSSAYNDNLQYIANIILNHLAANQTVNIVNPINGALNYSVQHINKNYQGLDPITVYFDSPAPTNVQFDISIKVFNTTKAPSVIRKNIQDAILSQFYFGYKNYEPNKMNVAINVNDYMLTIFNTIDTNCSIISQTIKKVSGGTASSSLMLPISEVAILNSSNINVNVELG